MNIDPRTLEILLWTGVIECLLATPLIWGVVNYYLSGQAAIDRLEKEERAKMRAGPPRGTNRTTGKEL